MPNFNDLSGNRYGKLVAIKRDGTNNQGQATWECICDCGNTLSHVAAGSLRFGQSKSCGCRAAENRRREAIERMVGRRFFNLTVLAFAGQNDSGALRWRCQCECGRVHIKTSAVLNGQTQCFSCVCRHKREWVRSPNLDVERKALYTKWHAMQSRCGNPKNRRYARYGGRGIYVCDEWQNFESFYVWALSNGYEKGLTIDRIDNDGPYSPENCRWVTLTDNQRNTATCIPVSVFLKADAQWTHFL